jgi:hypothetical protein
VLRLSERMDKNIEKARGRREMQKLGGGGGISRM